MTATILGAAAAAGCCLPTGTPEVMKQWVEGLWQVAYCLDAINRLLSVLVRLLAMLVHKGIWQWGLQPIMSLPC